MLFRSGVLDRLQQLAAAQAQRAQISKKDKYKLDELMRRCYRLPVTQKNSWESPHEVPLHLSALVNDNKKWFSKATNHYELDKKTEPGRMEQILLKEFKRAQSGIRVQNSLLISLAAAQKINEVQAAKIKQLTELVKPEDTKVRELASDIASDSLNMATILEEGQSNSNDLLKLQADSYIRAASERRNWWLTQSALSSDYVKQLQAIPVQIPSNATPAEFCLIGPEGRRLITEWSDHDVKRQSMYLQKQLVSKIAPLSASAAAGSGFKQPQNPSRKSNKQGKIGRASCRERV